MFSATTTADDIMQVVNGNDEFDTTALGVDSNNMENESTTLEVEPNNTELEVEVKQLPVDTTIDDVTEEYKSKRSIRSTDPSHLRKVLKDITNTQSAPTQIDVAAVTVYLQGNLYRKSKV